MAFNYYYLISSLPPLVFGQDPPVAVGAFLEECAKWCTAADLRMLSDIASGSRLGPHCPAVWQSWDTFDGELTGSINTLRRQRRAGADARMPATVKYIFDAEDPLQRERRREEVRWEFLSQRDWEHPFDVDLLVGYLLKLLIAHRLKRFDRTTGRDVFARISEVRYE